MQSSNEQKANALSGQLEYHFQKIETIREFNPDLAKRIEDFTLVLQAKNFTGVFDVDDDVYHNGVGISQSRFNYLKKSAFTYHYKTYVDIKSNLVRKAHFVTGDFIHRILLEKGTIKDKFCSEAGALAVAWLAKPDAINIRATKGFKNEIASLRELGFEPIDPALFDSAYMLENIFKDNELLNGLMTDSIKEKVVYSICPKTGLLRKAKVDILKEFKEFIYIGDLKSTMDIDSEKFDKSIQNYGYHIQGAYYEENIKDVFKKPVKQHLIPLIEKEPPFEVDLKFIDDASMRVGLRYCDKYLKQLAECYANRDFPRREIKVTSCGIPAWKMKDELIELNEY